MEAIVNASPRVLGPTELSNSFLGNLIQVCVVTRNFRRTLEGFVNLGIGPWAVRTVDASSLRATYRCRPADFTARLCLAHGPNMIWEVVEPLLGRSVYADFLERHGEGVQHLAFDCNGIDYDERVRQFEERGYPAIMHGTIFGGIDFHYFAAEGDLRTTVEIFRIPPGYEFPAPDEWYPAPPSGAAR
jgi:hypothetical protein